MPPRNPETIQEDLPDLDRAIRDFTANQSAGKAEEAEEAFKKLVSISRASADRKKAVWENIRAELDALDGKRSMRQWEIEEREALETLWRRLSSAWGFPDQRKSRAK